MNMKRKGFALRPLAIAVLTAVLAPVERLHARLWCLNDVSPELLKEWQTVFETVKGKAGELTEVIEKGRAEVKKFETITGQTNKEITDANAGLKAANETLTEIKARLLEVEQKAATKPGGPSDQVKSPGQIVAESAQFKAAVSAGGMISNVNVGSFHKAIISDPIGTNPQPLVAPLRLPGIIMPGLRRLTVRDLIPNLRTDSTVIYYAKENVFTNNAAVVFSSPNDRENIVKPESGITFTAASANVETIAHWIQASRQILADAKGLQDYIDSRLRYGLKLGEEGELLNGDGTNGHLSGLMANATAFNRGVSNDTMLDTLLKAMLQVALSYYDPDGLVMNPIDWTTIQLLKDTQGRYLIGNPQDSNTPRIWGQSIVSTQSMTQGQFLSGAFGLAASIWDREDANVRTSENTNDDFIRNMIRLLCEERLALTIYRSAALVKGTFPALGT